MSGRQERLAQEIYDQAFDKLESIKKQLDCAKKKSADQGEIDSLEQKLKSAESDYNIAKNSKHL